MDWPPNYTREFIKRDERLTALSASASLRAGAYEYYRTRPVEFINDWCVTYDPRNGSNGLPKTMPFVTFPKQDDLVDFLQCCIDNQISGLIEKSRDMGATWICCAYSVWLWIYSDGGSIGWGSRKEQLVDRIGVVDSIFEKMRIIIDYLPKFFLPRGYARDKHATYMKIVNPETGATITGEAGDNIGRGGRNLAYFKDEAQPLYSKIMTPNGFVAMGDVSVGDFVIGSNGLETKIVAINDVGIAPTYRIKMQDGTHVDCSENHLWTVEKSTTKKIETISAVNIAKGFIYNSPGGQVQYRYRVPLVAPVEFSQSNTSLPLHPYIVGALIGDGSVGSGCVSITSADDELIDKIRQLAPVGCVVNYSSRYTYNFVDEQRYTKKSRALSAVRKSGIYGSRAHTKFIPDQYKFSSVDDRIDLLRGLMDTDGSSSGGTVTYHTCSKTLADDVRFIVQSLGGVASLNMKPDHRGFRDMYCLHISMNSAIIPFSLKRKIKSMPSKGRHFGKTIIGVEKIGDLPVRCISVSADDGLYVTDHFTLTHNSAHYERPDMIEAALADNTNVQIDISSVHGTNTVFYRRRQAGVLFQKNKDDIDTRKVQVLVMDWRDHPAKDQEWYDRRKSKAEAEGLSHVFAQEVDRDYTSAVEGIVIPQKWVKAAIDAHKKLGIEPSGAAIAGQDIADEGGDKNALVIRRGILMTYADHWGEGDTGATARKSVMQCRARHVTSLQYDSIGVGAGFKAETNRLRTDGKLPKNMDIVAWNAGAGPLHPKRHIIKGDRTTEKNGDFYANLKAQGWWQLRRRFELTHKAVTQGLGDIDPDDLISIDSTLEKLHEITNELSQPTYKHSNAGKIVIDKKPDGAQSPNLADAIVMAYWPIMKSKFIA